MASLGTNYHGHDGYDTSLAEQMKYYDRLPGALRLLIDLAPIPQDTKAVWTLYQRDGLEKTLENVVLAFEAFAPGWTLASAIGMWKPHRRSRR